MRKYYQSREKTIRPKLRKIERAHSLPKVHKNFDRIQIFRPTVEKKNASHFSVGKCFTNLLDLLTQIHFARTPQSC